MPKPNRTAPADTVVKSLTTDPHSMSRAIDGGKYVATLTLAELVTYLKAELFSDGATSDTSAPMTADQIVEVRPWATRGWLRRHVAPVGVGARQRPLYLLADVDEAQGDAPPKTRAKAIVTRPVDDGDEIDALIASGSVRR